jgi:hypothetical protein
MPPADDIFAVFTDRIDATSQSRPDETWRVVDAAGHEHRWHVNGEPMASYSTMARYELPTLELVRTGSWFGDGEEHPIYEWKCRACGEVVRPGTCADTFQVWVPGVTHFRINGQTVSREEFVRRRHEAGLR